MKWGKHAKISVEMLKNCGLPLADAPVLITLTLFTPEQIKKLVYVSGVQNIYIFFPREQIFLELFSFTHVTLFGTLCISSL